MSEQMDFNDGKYTVTNDNGRLKALRYGQPWRDLTGDNLIYWMLVEAIKLKQERDALAEWKRQAEWIDKPFKAEALAEYGFAAPTPREFSKKILERHRPHVAKLQAERDELEAKLKELEGQEPFELNWPEYHHNGMGCGLEDRGITDRYEAMRHGWESALERVDEVLPEVFYTRPVPAEPVNARLLQAVKSLLSWIDDYAETSDPCFPAVEKQALEAVTATEAQQAEPVRLTDEQINGADGWLQEAPFWRVVKFARTVEAAVLRANGFKVEG